MNWIRIQDGKPPYHKNVLIWTEAGAEMASRQEGFKSPITGQQYPDCWITYTHVVTNGEVIHWCAIQGPEQCPGGHSDESGIDRVISWLKANCNAERSREAKQALAEAHNAAMMIKLELRTARNGEEGK